jgi:G:T-mismatch repair DNA endonuclease (very short patch repair protein)
MIGNTNMKGYKVSPEARAKHGTTMKKKFQDPAYCERYRVAMNMKPNKPETFLLGLLEKMYPGEWKYTGDFSFIINGKNPDFVNVNGQKKIIEVFGDYWHRGEDPADRVAAFSPFGYQTLVIWERDLKDVAVVTSRIHDFNREEMT